MNKSVIVTANEKGQVISESSNPEYGYIRVQQEKASFEGGWMRKKLISALISAPINDLKSMGFKSGQILPGKIIVVEQLTPFNEENPEKDLKIAGDTGVVCTIGGQEIYRRAFYTEEQGSGDILISHDNNDEIKARKAELEQTTAKTNVKSDLG